MDMDVVTLWMRRIGVWHIYTHIHMCRQVSSQSESCQRCRYRWLECSEKPLGVVSGFHRRFLNVCHVIVMWLCSAYAMKTHFPCQDQLHALCQIISSGFVSVMFASRLLVLDSQYHSPGQSSILRFIVSSVLCSATPCSFLSVFIHARSYHASLKCRLGSFPLP